MLMIQKINSTIQNAINKYSHLNLGNKEVVTPYYINDKRRRDLRAMVGKGTPEEIIMEAQIWAKLKGLDLSVLEASQIKEFLTTRNLGVDCSAFIVHTLDPYYVEKNGHHIWRDLKIPNKSLRAKLSYALRPVEQLGAQIITNADNAFEVEINDTKPTDLIRSKAKKNNGHHIMLITKVTKDDNGNVTEIEYTHASPYYGKDNGIKTGIIKITDVTKPLQDQDWLEADEHGVCHTKEGFMVDVTDNGIRRLKSLPE